MIHVYIVNEAVYANLFHPYADIINEQSTTNHRKSTLNERTHGQTWLSYGRNAILISFRVLIYLADGDLHSSLKSSSGHAGITHQ